jgi:hypothetical protein
MHHCYLFLSSQIPPHISPMFSTQQSFIGNVGPSVFPEVERSLALNEASDIDEVINSIPLGYRDALRQPLKKVASDTKKLYRAQSLLESWKEHQQVGTYPAHCQPKPTKYILRKCGRLYKEYCDNLLSASIRAKEGEVEFYKERLGPKELFLALEPFITTRKNSIILNSPDDFEEVLNKCDAYAERVRFIVESKMEHGSDMVGDTTAPTQSIQTMVSRAVSAAFKKRNALPVSFHSLASECTANKRPPLFFL